MQIQFLGSGGAFTDHRVNYNNNAIVLTSQGWVLLDCGQTASQSLLEIDIHPSELTAVLITHLHCDHASPEPIIWKRYYSSKEGPPAFLSTPIYSPSDVLTPLIASLEPFIGTFGDKTATVRTNGCEQLIQAHHTTDCTIGDTEFKFFPVHHIHHDEIDKPAYGIRITQGNTRIYWSGDTTFDSEWICKAAEDPLTQTIFHECMFFPVFQGTAHTHWVELQTLPSQVLKKIVLMHHTVVPPNTDISQCAGAAERHQVFTW